jgi:glycosyltransferase involved in cell wall biosynthesis
MRFSVITVNYNSGAFLEQTIKSVLSQRTNRFELEYLVVDGGSTDGSHALLEKYARQIDTLVIEKDRGPAHALNKGLALAQGDILAWLNADDIYHPQALERVFEAVQAAPKAPMYFGACTLVDEQNQEVHSAITRFKEMFYPLSSRFTYQCLNYISQPALFFQRSAWELAGPLREDLLAAWDYEFFLRLWHSGKAVQIPGKAPLAAFRVHQQSISRQHFSQQFKEEYETARADAGSWSLQNLIHFFVRWGIVSIYSLMQIQQKNREKSCV